MAEIRNAGRDGQKETSALLERLEKIGCRTDEALERVFGDGEFYREMLLELLDDPAFAELGKAMEEGSAKKAFDAAHTLRGAALTLGVLPVGRPAAKLTELLRVSEEITETARQTFAELESGLAAVRKAALLEEERFF